MTATTDLDRLTRLQRLMAQAERLAEKLDGHPDILRQVTITHLTVSIRVSDVQPIQQAGQAA